jgi:glycyl-tRNA synthetase beta subunit
MLIGRSMSFSVAAGLSHAGALLPIDAPKEALAEALEFVVERLRGHLREQGFAFDVVDAVLAARGDDPFRASESVGQLSRWVTRDDWGTILANYARCVRITRDLDDRYELNPSQFVQPAEHELYHAYTEAAGVITPNSTVDAFLEAFTPLTEVIDWYFARESGVMVMAEDPALRQNRLAQMQDIAALADGIVDLSRLEGF